MGWGDGGGGGGSKFFFLFNFKIVIQHFAVSGQPTVPLCEYGINK